MPQLRKIALDAISSTPKNPRSDLAEDDVLRGLAASLGSEEDPQLVEPPVVEKIGENEYRILAGERRIKAARLAGWEQIPCLVHPLLDPAQAHTLRLLENLHRQELHPLDKAAALKIAWLTANADAMELQDQVRKVLGVGQTPGETLTALETLLLDHDFAPTHPAVTWDEVLDQLGVELTAGKRKRLLRVLGIESEVQERVRALAVSEAGLRALGQMEPEAQAQLVEAIEEDPELAQKVRRIAHAVNHHDYELEDALNEAQGQAALDDEDVLPSDAEAHIENQDQDSPDEDLLMDTVVALMEIAELPNGVTSTYTYNDVGWLSQLVHTNDTETLLSFGYQYDYVGNRTSVTETLREPVSLGGTDDNEKREPVIITYDYDPLYRLTDADYNDGAYFDYTYDAVGNRLTLDSDQSSVISYQYDAANRLTSVGGAAYTWDANGNLLYDGANDYIYDHANRLVHTNPHSGIYTYDEYAYNGLGDRLSHTHSEPSGDVTTHYTLDLAAGLTQVLADGSNTYHYGLGRISQGNSVGLFEGSTEYFLADALGSVRQLTDASGAVTLTKSYTPFGEVLSTDGDGTSSYGYTGEWTDSTGMVYLRARYYAPWQGRFTTRDTWAGEPTRPASLNRYVYAEGNPVRYTDHTGQWIDTVIDIAFIGYDIYQLVDHINQGCWDANRDVINDDLIALGLDIVGAALPFATGLGMAARAGSKIDDLVRISRFPGAARLWKHGDEVAELVIDYIYKKSMRNADSAFAVLGRHLNNANSYEIVAKAKKALHLDLDPELYKIFKETFGEKKFWDFLNERYIREIGERNIPVMLTRTYDTVDEIEGYLGKEVRMLVNKFDYELVGKWLLPAK